MQIYCPNCKVLQTASVVRDYQFRECGLDNVFFESIQGLTCPECQLEMPALPVHDAPLNAAIAHELSLKTDFLTRDEFEIVWNFALQTIEDNAEVANYVSMNMIDMLASAFHFQSREIRGIVHQLLLGNLTEKDDAKRQTVYEICRNQLKKRLMSHTMMAERTDKPNFGDAEQRKYAEGDLRDILRKICEIIPRWESRSTVDDSGGITVYLTAPEFVSENSQA